MTPNQKRILNEFIDWFETLNQQDAEDFMRVIGRVLMGLKK